MSETIAISLCLITKNEEHCLGRCLDSVRDLVDEIIVVDTGSTDNTLRIAAQYGAFIFSYPWNNDFSAARNYSLSKASGNWILVLDADEVLESLTRDNINQLIKQSPAEGYYFTICSYLDGSDQKTEDYVVRLFKNNSAYRFAGAIHEQIAGSILNCNRENGVVFAPFTINHYGYMEKEIKGKGKFARNVTIIKNALIEKPQDPFLHFSLALEYLQARDFQQAGTAIQKALALIRGEEGYVPQVLTAHLLIKLAEPATPDIENLFCRAIQSLPDNGDLKCLYGLWLMKQARFAEAVQVVEAALREEINLLDCCRAHSFLGDLCYLAGSSDKAVGHFIIALNKNTEDLYPFSRLLNLMSNFSKITDFRDVFENLSSEITVDILQRAVNRGLYESALASILLAIINSIKINDVAYVLSLCTAYLKKLGEASPPKGLKNQIYEILLRSGDELYFQSRLLELSGSQISFIRENVERCTWENLLLVSTIVLDGSTEGCVKFWEDRFLGTNCAQAFKG